MFRAPGGNRLGWVSHDSTVNVLECATAEHVTLTLKTPHLPMMDILWITPNSFVAAGHDNAPYLFSVANGAITNGVSLDQKTGPGAKAAGGPSNLADWKNRDNLGAADGAKDQSLDTQHQNCITSLAPFGGTPEKREAFSTSGLDGGIGVWNIGGLSKAIAGLKIQ